MRRGTLSAPPKGETDAVRIAGIDVHKKMLAVAVADVAVDGDFHFERQKTGTTPIDLRRLADWLVEHEVEEIVMESTARYLATSVGGPGTALATSTPCARRSAAPRGYAASRPGAIESRARRPQEDFPDAERLVKRLVAQELTLSFVPDAEQRLWRTVMRRKYQITRNRVQLHNRLEALLEEAHIKVSSIVSDLLGISARRMLQALADGETDPAAPSRGSRPRACAPHRRSCAMPSRRVRRCIRSTAGS